MNFENSETKARSLSVLDFRVAGSRQTSVFNGRTTELWRVQLQPNPMFAPGKATRLTTVAQPLQIFEVVRVGFGGTLRIKNSNASSPQAKQ